jgi:hypothetical protein
MPGHSDDLSLPTLDDQEMVEVPGPIISSVARAVRSVLSEILCIDAV